LSKFSMLAFSESSEEIKSFKNGDYDEIQCRWFFINLIWPYHPMVKKCNVV
jgi:hypothetical protein